MDRGAWEPGRLQFLGDTTEQLSSSRILDLQYRVNFCIYMQSDSVMHIYSSSYSFPLWFITGF